MLLPLAGPLDGAFLLHYLDSHRAPGVDEVVGTSYRRLVAVGSRVGVVQVNLAGALPTIDAPSVAITLAPSLDPHRDLVLARVRRLLDADAPVDAIERDLRADPALASRWHRGLRLPGVLDPFEAAVRVVLGQQVSMRSATTLSGRLVARFGHHEPGFAPATGSLFPSAARLAALAPEELIACGILASRSRALLSLARAVDSGQLVLEADGDPDAFIAQLDALPGIGPWTASYIAMRTRLARDVFLAGDLAVRRSLGVSEPAALRHAERWRPWRSHALLQLWFPYVQASSPGPSVDAAASRKKPGTGETAPVRRRRASLSAKPERGRG